jgi:hypothetical protein
MFIKDPVTRDLPPWRFSGGSLPRLKKSTMTAAYIIFTDLLTLIATSKEVKL